MLPTSPKRISVAPIKLPSKTVRNVLTSKQITSQTTNYSLFQISEIAPASGDLDLATLNKSDFVKFSYGRPLINKIDHNNILGINYELGKSKVSDFIQSNTNTRTCKKEITKNSDHIDDRWLPG